MTPSGELGSQASVRLLASKARIIGLWEQHLRAEVPATSAERRAILVDTLPDLLDHLAEALESTHPRASATTGTDAAEEHGGERVRVTHFRLQDVITEYRLLRQVLVQVLEEDAPLTTNERNILHSSIDEAMTKACTAYTLVQEGFREQLFAILTHDLRGPLTAASTDLALMGASLSTVCRSAAPRLSSTFRWMRE